MSFIIFSRLLSKFSTLIDLYFNLGSGIVKICKTAILIITINMNFESIIIILLVFAILYVWIFINFFLNNSLTKERLREFLEKQEGLEKITRYS